MLINVTLSLTANNVIIMVLSSIHDKYNYKLRYSICTSRCKVFTSFNVSLFYCKGFSIFSIVGVEF